MKKELFNDYFNELLNLEEVHEEIQLDGIHYVLDITKDENSVTLKITNLTNTKEKKDKADFENWLKMVDDDLFSEVLSSFDGSIESLYQSENYQEAIDKVKSRTKEIVEEKIKNLYKLIGQ